MRCTAGCGSAAAQPVRPRRNATHCDKNHWRAAHERRSMLQTRGRDACRLFACMQREGGRRRGCCAASACVALRACCVRALSHRCAFRTASAARANCRRNISAVSAAAVAAVVRRVGEECGGTQRRGSAAEKKCQRENRTGNKYKVKMEMKDKEDRVGENEK